jgi:hypothetical protein
MTDVRLVTHLANQLEPADLRDYLRLAGWSPERADDRRSVWLHRSGAQVFVPGQRLSDYEQLLDLAVVGIARAEERDADDVVSDLTWRQYDKFYVRRPSPSSSLPLEEAIGFHEALGDLIVSAARASWEPRPSYRGPRPGRVISYLERVRLIPSVPGSFVARALLPLNTLEGTPLPLVGPAEPAVRDVSTTILRATGAAVESARAIALGSSNSLWDDAVQEGVSANLCDALARLSGRDAEASSQVDLRIDWTWAAPDDPMSPVSVPAGLAPILDYGSDYLRGGPEEHTIRITGLVTHLHREKGTGPGEITVRGYIEQWDAGSRALRVELDEGTYRQAISAHEAGTTVRLTAQVRRAMGRVEVVHVVDLDLLGLAIPTVQDTS